MNQSAAIALAALAEHVDEIVDGLFDSGFMSSESDVDVVDALSVVGRLFRRFECVAIDVVGEVVKRSETGDVDARLTSRFGAHNVSELVQRATRVGPQTAARWQRGAKAVRQEPCLVSGELLPAPFPAMREALVAGDVGVDGLLAVTTALADVERRAGRDALLIADAELAAVARGDGADAAPPACADLLRVQATVWATVLDQDGTEPQEREALRLRGVSLGRPRNGLVPVRGNLLVEAAAQMQMIFDAEGSPRVEGHVGRVQFRAANEHGDAEDEFIPPDDRRPAQRRHDALATALFVAAASKALPTIGGAAPTLVVSVRESDLRSGTGWAHAQGCEEPLPIGAAHHVGCGGTIQRVVLNAEGRIVRIGTEERVFNRHQRRAIALRDGGCLIPGCGVPAAWCEIHHVIEHARGGPTHTDNGVLLCWYHHRFLERHEWGIRMNRGVPEVRAPRWNDSSGRWRPVTRSKTRLADLAVRRT